MNATIALPVLSADDAIGADVLGMAASLRGAGYTVTLAAEKSLIADDVVPMESLLTANSDDLLIYHHSYGNNLGVRVVRSWPGRVAVKYHNVTPPRFFETEHRRDAEAGLQQAMELAKAVPFWVDSAFNGEGLPQACEELPPFMPTEHLVNLEPDASFAARLDDWTTTLLCVGRVAPNKNLLLAIDALAAYRGHDPHARLIIAGRHVFPDYSDAVQSRIVQHGLEGSVAITGRVTSQQLKALYLSADALLVTSEHEGFCVPLVEAMALGVPTVAVPLTAVPGTAGPFAKYAEANPSAIATAVNELVNDPRQREQHLLAGRHRYRERYRPESIRRRFLELVATLSA